MAHEAVARPGSDDEQTRYHVDTVSSLTEKALAEYRAQLAPHEVSFEQTSGFFVLTTHGDVSAAQMEAWLAVSAAYRDDHPGEPPFLLIDIREGSGISQAARRLVSNRAKERPGALYMGIFGGSLATRAIFALLVKGTSLASRGFQLTAHMLANESEARAWLAEHRRQYLANQSSPPSS